MNLPAPPANPETLAFTDAAREGRFMIRRCTSCAKPHWYPRAVCPFCAGNTAWEEASGLGTLYAFSTLARATPPYTIAYVTLDEGPTMMTSIVDADVGALAIGQRMQVAFRVAEDGTPVACFIPASPRSP